MQRENCFLPFDDTRLYPTCPDGRIILPANEKQDIRDTILDLISQKKIDLTDLQILRLRQLLPRPTMGDIAAEIKISERSVMRRLKKMRQKLVTSQNFAGTYPKLQE